MSVYFSTGYATGAAQPMTHARILWQNLAGTITASTEADGFAAANAGRIDTASWWMPTAAPAWWQIDYASTKTVDAVGIAAHTLAGIEVTISALVAAAWVDVATITPADNSALLVLFEAVQADAVRISIAATARIGVVYTGAALEMPRMGYTNLGPIDLGRQVVLRSYISEGGQLLNRFIQRRGLAGQLSWANLPEDWYRANMDAFSLTAQTEPFFIATRPEGYASDCAYCWTDSVITPQRAGVRNFMNLQINVTGHADA